MFSSDIVKKRILIIVAICFVVLVVVFIVLGFMFGNKASNPYGNGIIIQNYNDKIKNLPSEMKQGTEAYLYNIADRNNKGSYNLKSIKDAYIRNGSNTQDYSESKNLYSGNYIVDIESIKQSYYIQYTYSSDQKNVHAPGDAIIVSCLPKDKLIYGIFNCSDFISAQASKYEDIIQFLPFENFSFKLSANATSGEDKVILVAELRIPDSDLTGDSVSDSKVIDMYKKEVTDWIKSKNLNPDDYIITYNYSDNGIIQD